MAHQVFWAGEISELDDFGSPIDDTVIDARTIRGPWMLMTPSSFALYGGTEGRFGIGLGQRFVRQSDGRWLKVEG